jgi:hypothetical protein
MLIPVQKKAAVCCCYLNVVVVEARLFVSEKINMSLAFKVKNSMVHIGSKKVIIFVINLAYLAENIALNYYTHCRV